MFKRLFGKQINNITMAAALIALFSLASRFLGIIRDRILAGQFGAGETLDIYYAAFRIPDLIFNLVVLGALSAGFIPIFTSLVKDFKCDKESCDSQDRNHEAWTLGNNILQLLLLTLFCLSVILIVFAPLLIKFISPGYDAEAQKSIVSLTRIMFLSPLFLGMSGILGGVLQSFKRFLVYSFAPIFYNLGIIIGALYFVDLWGINGLAWGVVLGAFLHMLVQIPTVCRLGFRIKFKINWKDLNTWKIVKMMGPRTLSLAISQINLVVITIIASGLSSGSLTIFNFANNLQSFPIGIFGISYAIAAFPALSEFAFNKEKLAENFSGAMRQILFFIIPATVLIIIFRAQIIRVVLGTGSFDWQDTILTMNTLGFFALSLFAQATLPLLTRVFYARHNSKTPFYLGFLSILLNIFLSYFLSAKMGVAGLALAFSIASIFNFLLLWIYLYVKVGTLDLAHILVSVLKFAFSAIAAGIAAQLMKVVVWPFIDMTKFSGVFIQLLISLSVGLLVYIFFCYLVRCEELSSLFATLRRKLPIQKIKLGDQGEARGN